MIELLKRKGAALLGSAAKVVPALGNLGLYQRHYDVDYQIVVYFEMPLARIRALRLVPDGLTPYHIGERRRPDRSIEKMGVCYITLMKLTGGSVPTPDSGGGLAFDEILWGVRVQPGNAKAHLALSIVANRLATNHAVAQDFLEAKDHYEVYRRDGPSLAFHFADRQPDTLVASLGGRPVCGIHLGSTALLDSRFAYLPATAEVFKPKNAHSEHMYRYEFAGLGLLQILTAAELAPDAVFAFWAHDFFAVDGGNLFDAPTAGAHVPVRVKATEVYVSRRGSPGHQFLNRSIIYP